MDEESKPAHIIGGMQLGEIEIENALDGPCNLPLEDPGFAQVEQQRSLRRGVLETVFCQWKTPEQEAAIVMRLAARIDARLVEYG